MTTKKEIQRRRKTLKRRHGLAYRQVCEILFAADPIGINIGFNADEYEPEVDTILPKLKACGNAAEVRTVVHEAFRKWFGAASAGPIENYQAIAERIWQEVMPYWTD